MRMVREVSRISGVSVRTLHHYDDIGLLKPTAVTEAGYRLYDDRALERLQLILFFKELQFSLADIKKMIDAPDFDREAALREQITLLQLQKKHLEQLIDLARKTVKKGELPMDFSAFENREAEQYAAEVRKRWGNTAEYREYAENHADEDNAEGLMAIFAEFGALRGGDPGSAEAQKLVETLKRYITDHYYTCTNVTLSGLSLMYTEDERFRDNIDRVGGIGTAGFAADAIRIFCQ